MTGCSVVIVVVRMQSGNDISPVLRVMHMHLLNLLDMANYMSG